MADDNSTSSLQIEPSAQPRAEFSGVESFNGNFKHDDALRDVISPGGANGKKLQDAARSPDTGTRGNLQNLQPGEAEHFFKIVENRAPGSGGGENYYIAETVAVSEAGASPRPTRQTYTRYIEVPRDAEGLQNLKDYLEANGATDTDFLDAARNRNALAPGQGRFEVLSGPAESESH